jgi:hypothetical protein
MSIKFNALIIGAASLLLASEAKADFLQFKLDNTFNGASPSSTAPWLTATFTSPASGTVNLALQSSLNISSEFFGSLGFNFNPPISALTGVSQNGGSPASISWSENGEDLQGGGNQGKGFDVMINFETANAGHFKGSDLITFVFSGNGITAADFNDFNAGGLQIAAHVQGIPNGPSGAVSGVRTAETTVPDGGSTLILLGIGTTLFALVRRTLIS